MRRLLIVMASVWMAGCADRLSLDATPPTAPAGLHVDTIRGRTVADPWRWLESTADSVGEWLAGQDRYATSLLAASGDRPAVLRRIVELLRVDVATRPIERGGRYFYMRRAADQERFAIFMREGQGGVDRKIIDPFEVSSAEPVTVSLASVSEDGRLIAYSVGRAGQDLAEVRIHDIDQRRDLPFRLPAGLYTTVQVLSDGSGVFYVRVEDDGPRVYFHPLDRPALNDTVIFGDAYGPDAAIAAALTADEEGLGIVIFHGQDGAVTEVFYRAIEESATTTPIVTGVPASFLPVFAGDRVLLHTDWQAPNRRVLSVPLAAPQQSNWVEVVPESADLIESVSFAAGRIVVSTLHNACSRLLVYTPDGAVLDTVALPMPGTVESVASRGSTSEVFFSFTSFVMPPTVLLYDIENGTVSTWQTDPAPTPTGIVVRQVELRSADGAMVPMFLVHRADLPADGGNPALLTGFGALGVSVTPGFTAEASIVTERGGVFAVVNVRGGGEFGAAWHDAGSGIAKSRAVDDFLAAAEWLVDNGLASPDRLVASGSTHGGFLVLAAMIRKPGLFAGVIADHPVTDLLRLRDWPTTATWTAEYGSPDIDAELDSLLSISPYVRADATAGYPAVLLLSGGDSPVPGFHARKMAAALQAGSSSNPVLLRDMTASAPQQAVSLPIEYLADTITFYLARTTVPADSG